MCKNYKLSLLVNTMYYDELAVLHLLKFGCLLQMSHSNKLSGKWHVSLSWLRN